MGIINAEEREHYLTKEEAAQYLGCSISSVEAYMRQFNFSTFKLPLDTRAYLRREDVDYVKRLKEAARGMPA